MELEEALELLAKIVKDSEASDGNKHLNFTLVPAAEKKKYQEALAVAKDAVARGKLSEDELNRTLRLN